MVNSANIVEITIIHPYISEWAKWHSAVSSIARRRHFKSAAQEEEPGWSQEEENL